MTTHGVQISDMDTNYRLTFSRIRGLASGLTALQTPRLTHAANLQKLWAFSSEGTLVAKFSDIT